MTFSADALWQVAAATLGGLAIGLERQWSGHAKGPDARFAGLRTFTMMGLIAGLSGWWWTAGLHAFAIVLLSGTTGVIVASFVVRSRKDIDATTEIAAMVVLAAGVTAGVGQIAVSSAIVALTFLLLVEKSRLHEIAEHLGETELLAAARFAVMAAVVLPLLPEELGPFGALGLVRPRQLWMLVLFFSGLSFAGYLARRALGEHRGYAIAGVLGGLVSSTSVTLTFSRLSRARQTDGPSLSAGVLGANMMLFPRVLIASAVLAPALAWALWPVFVAPVLIALGLFAWGIRSAGKAARDTGPKNPLELVAALQMALLFQIVLFGVSLAEKYFGEAGLYGSAAVLGLTDVDALTVSMAQRVNASTPAAVAARALTLGILANTLVKTTIALVVGRGSYRVRTAIGLGLLAVALTAWLAITMSRV
ncbi:MAG TPA: MgtC/SapB family protein [Vicinamibacterales bacterium]|nr:MgtC/SapB family protein [Vicinamibacterales bacterium]